VRILGIESSCDETAAAVVEDGSRILSSVVASQIATHARYGGVVPELASREHLRAIVPVVRLALEQFLESEPEIRPIERVRDLLGRVESGVPDLGQRHREHLIRRLRRGE